MDRWGRKRDRRRKKGERKEGIKGGQAALKTLSGESLKDSIQAKDRCLRKDYLGLKKQDQIGERFCFQTKKKINKRQNVPRRQTAAFQ